MFEEIGMKKLAVIVFLVTLLLLSGCTTNKSNEDKGTNGVTPSNDNENGDTNNEPDEAGFMPFDYPPVDLEKVAFILPMGGMTGGHVTPIDHQYYVSYDFDKGDEAAVDIAVYSPSDGVVTDIQHMSVAAGDTPIPVDDYRLVIKHTSTISSIYIHIDVLSDKLSLVDPGLGNYSSVNVEVSAGEVIGWYGGSVDYNIVDEDVLLGFVNSDSYAQESWKIHCPDPFDYFNEFIKNIMVGKCLRTADPVGGKICYDVDGRLVGTWFLNNTNGYEGADTDRYWAGHLTIAYDSIDSDAIVVSIGTFVDSAKQFCVKGNSPDPVNVSVGELVAYELVDFNYYRDEEVWDRKSFVHGLKIKNNDYVQGVILLQLVEDRKLRVEVFVGKDASEVGGFTENVSIYVR